MTGSDIWKIIWPIMEKDEIHQVRNDVIILDGWYSSFRQLPNIILIIKS